MSDGITVALEAMRSDATTWENASEDLGAPQEAVTTLRIDPTAFSMWAVERGIDQTYDDARSALERMLEEAADYFGQISSDLTQAAAQYERDDEQGKHDIENAY
jgi:hypothetical protein